MLLAGLFAADPGCRPRFTNCLPFVPTYSPKAWLTAIPKCLRNGRPITRYSGAHGAEEKDLIVGLTCGSSRAANAEARSRSSLAAPAIGPRQPIFNDGMLA